ncbi:hypothetical protein ACL03H_09660 [Saccharopolyspora sp. MS10]|uniref:DUF7144 family membrane protein n=1 Tax=Saccharopolyspora sp. MS10 TaxID=3385973 RepID=UPI0039A2422F
MFSHRIDRRRTGWVGWVYFAAVVLVISGMVQAVNGLVLLARTGTTYVVPGGTVQLDLGTLGFGLLVAGVVLAAVGIGLFGGRIWARVLAVVLAVLSLLANIALFAAYPVWSAVVIVLDVLVVYALIAHGREVRRG